jgi:hypothetical protein
MSMDDLSVTPSGGLSYLLDSGVGKKTRSDLLLFAPRGDRIIKRSILARIVNSHAHSQQPYLVLRSISTKSSTILVEVDQAEPLPFALNWVQWLHGMIFHLTVPL